MLPIREGERRMAARNFSTGFLATWFGVTALCLMAVAGWALGGSLWSFDTPGGRALVAIVAGYAAGGAAILILHRRGSAITSVGAVRTLLLAFCGVFLAVLVLDVAFSRKVLLVLFGVSLVLTAVVFALPRQIAITATVLALLAASAALVASSLRAAPVGVTASREVMLSTSLYNLKVTFRFGTIPADSVKGGGIAPLGDGYLLVTGPGHVYTVRWTAGRFDIVEKPLRVPINTDDFRAAVANRPVDQRMFRVADLFVQELGGDSIRIFASHHMWRRDADCFVLRVSSVAGNRESLLQASDVTWKTLFETSPCLKIKIQWHAFHGGQSGGRMSLLDSRTMLLTVGDHEFDGVNSTEILPQDTTASYGKTLTIDLQTGAGRLFSRGHRNPQGLVITRDASIWLTEHGPQGGDELNRIEAGVNYGWPLETYGTDYGKQSWPLNKEQGRHTRFAPPAFAWVPAIGVGNLIEIKGKPFAHWDGDLLVASLVGRTLFRIRVQDDRVRFVEPIRVGEMIRDLAQGRDGTLALWLDGGGVAVIEPAVSAEASGESLFSSMCAGCHQVRNGLAHGIGPDLNGIARRPVAAARGFPYSPALSALNGRWTDNRLDELLRSAQTLAPGTAMPDSLVPDSAARKAIVRYLRTLR